VIDFRYHVVSIVAVFLALALGLFIGATTLRGTVKGDITNRTQSVVHNNGELRSENSDLHSQLSRGQSFDSALQPYALQGRLVGESVVVISAPGVDNNIRKDLLAALAQSGASVAGDVRLQDALLDPDQDQFLGTLADKLAINGHPLPNAAGAVRALALLADALMTNSQKPPVSRGAAAKVLSAYDAGNLLSVNGDQPQSAGVAILLAAPAPTSADASVGAQQQSLLATFARDLDRDGVGAVITGPASADASGGLLDVVRSDNNLRDAVSTVDGVDLPSGGTATVLAAAEPAGGRAGSYGSGPGADAPLPSPSSS
jgi:hypothetical protein